MQLLCCLDFAGQHAAWKHHSRCLLLQCRYQRLGKRSQSGSLDSGTPLGTPVGTPYLALTPSASPGQLAAEHAVYADFMRTTLEIINTIITTGLTSCLVLHCCACIHWHYINFWPIGRSTGGCWNQRTTYVVLMPARVN